MGEDRLVIHSCEGSSRSVVRNSLDAEVGHGGEMGQNTWLNGHLLDSKVST